MAPALLPKGRVKSWPIILVAGVGLLSPVRGAESSAEWRTDQAAAGPAGHGSLRLVQTIPLPDVAGVFNQMAADAGGQVLFATAPTRSTLEVIDLRTGKLRGSLFGKVAASVAVAPDLNRIFVTRRTEVVVYDRATLAPVTSVNLRNHVNELQYDAAERRVYVACQNTDRSGLAILNAATCDVVGMLPLPAKPMGFAREEKGRRIFANLPTLNEVVVLNRDTQAILQTWTLKGTSANYPMALDEAHHRLLVGCRNPPELAVFDTETGRLLASPGTCGDADGVFYDGFRRRVYVSGGEGFVDVIEQRDSDTYVVTARVRTASGARNSFFSPALDRLFIAIPQRDNPQSEIQVYSPSD